MSAGTSSGSKRSRRWPSSIAYVNATSALPVAIPGGLDLLHARGQVAVEAHRYVGIRYWGGALWLFNAVLVGWLIGRRRVGAVLAIEVAANIIHIALDVGFVLGLGWGVAGVATATLVSEGGKLVAAAIVAVPRRRW